MKFRFTALGLLSGLLLLLCFSFVLLKPTHKVAASVGGQITGTVKLDGVAPKAKVIDMSKEPSCAQIHASKPATTEGVVVGSGGGLGNVVLYLSEGYSGNEPAPSQPATLEQKGCLYLPHVVALNVGQKLVITNSDQTSHNIHPMPKPGGGNPEWNKSQLSGSGPIEVTYNGEEIAMPVKCNVHPWMHAFIAVVKGPHAVTDDAGSFKLDNVPPGTYTLTAWQETYGVQTSKVTVAPGKPATVDFTFKAK
ncbi:MAG TPA: carboxypeptidase regulatory-like domain-containing protein [Candidatus Acidoferrum sp.]|nr:carboxypeptidase regulatory-like domain-containing protein [Candidatus Acidoferrum sp.]